MSRYSFFFFRNEYVHIYETNSWEDFIRVEQISFFPTKILGDKQNVLNRKLQNYKMKVTGFKAKTRQEYPINLQ